MIKNEFLFANCKFCTNFHEHPEHSLGFCIEIEEFMDEEDYTDDCTEFELIPQFFKEYNESFK